MITVGIYLNFAGNCADAIALYEKAFGIKATEVCKYGEMPPSPNFPVTDANRNLILHSYLNIGGALIMSADVPQGATKGDNTYISITDTDEKRVQFAWNVLKENGTIYMDLQPTFFAACHGSLQDKFGVNWMFTVPQTKA